jgi:hypothetical protein
VTPWVHKQPRDIKENVLSNHEVWRFLVPCLLVGYVFRDSLRASNARRKGEERAGGASFKSARIVILARPDA